MSTIIISIGGVVSVNFGDRLKELRSKNGITQTKLAQLLNITKSVVSYYERQERMPSPDVLMKLASIFHVSVDYLMGIDKKKTIDVSDLSDEDISVLNHLADTLRNKNKKGKP